LTPPVIFLAALVTLLLGVIYVDGVVTAQEKQRLQATLNRFVPTEGNVRQLIQLMLKGAGQLQIYKKSSELVILMAPLTAPQRLLLLGFGYQMSAADGDMDAREKKYLQVIANNLKVDPRYLAVLEASFSHQGVVEPNALEEVQSLLDPARFQELDTIFLEAASELLAVLPTKPEPKATQQKRSFSYEQLKEFQKSREQIDNLCHQFYQIIKDCVDNEFLPYTLPDEIGKISHKLQSQRFRVAVIGEFSQGKSTLLNALLGEEIQPVRAIPCSGTVTVLRYGAQKRVICCYKDGRKEDIPFDQYKIKAAISKEAALEHRSEELSNSNLDEIIFEHPDLDLCKSGVEIIDSPGLNEHPERTAITQKLLKDTDAAIFLTNAMRLLPEKEKELLQDVRNQLNGGKEDEPAENLFIVVNFMDSLDDEQDRLDVRQRLESFVRDKNLLAGKNRIHYISAKAALKAILEGKQNEYLKDFQAFTNSIEQFLTVERGSLQIKKFVSKIKDLIDSGLDGLTQAVEVVDGKIKISESQKHEILEKIGAASGRDVKIRLLADQLIEKVLEEAAESWNEWYEGLGDRMIERAERWHSEHNPAWSQDKLIKDYINQFSRDLSREIDNWGNQQLRDVILKHNIKVLDENIE
ncbi:dynamin family protein, partial [Planktothrix sp. FACHB-1355]